MLSGIISSTNVSFDESENSFLSAQRSPLFIEQQTDDSDDTKKISIDQSSQDSMDSKSKSVLSDNQQNTNTTQKVRDATKSAIEQDNQAWSYYQSLLAKHTIKGCL